MGQAGPANLRAGKEDHTFLHQSPSTWAAGDRGRFITNPNNALFYVGEIPENYHRFFVLFDLPKIGKLNDHWERERTNHKGIVIAHFVALNV